MSQRKKSPAFFVVLVVLLAIVLVFLSRILPRVIAPPFTKKDRAAYQRQLQWPVYLEESFDDDQFCAAADRTGGYEFFDDYDFTWSECNAQYYWQIDFFSPESHINAKGLLGDQPLEDFVLTANFTKLTGYSKRFDYGFIFNYQDDENYYSLTINDGGEINIARTYQGDRKLIFTTIFAPEVTRTDRFDQLTLSFEDGQGLIFLNEQYIAQFKDTRIPQGHLGFVVEIPSGPSGSIIIYIDNITLRVPDQIGGGEVNLGDKVALVPWLQNGA